MSAISSAEITKILDQFETYMRAPTRKVRCPVCLSADRRTLNRRLLERNVSDNAIAKELGLATGSVRHHRRDCLVTRGGAPLRASGGIIPRQQKRFMPGGRVSTQKKWFLDELLYLRDEAMTKGDRKELHRLAVKIDEAAGEYRKARAEERAEKATAPKPTEEEDLDLSPETRSAMRLVGKTEEKLDGRATDPDPANLL